MCNNSSSGGGCQPGANGAVGEKTTVESTPQNSPTQAREPATGVIYKITNTLNGKFYIGKTKQKLSRRITQHKYDSKKGSLGLGAAIRKYGWENFTVEVIETCPIDKLNEREIFFIAELNSKSPNGYNLTDGGDGTVNPSAESRAKNSASNKEQKRSPETRANISAGHKGKNKGKKHKPESIAKMSASKKGENNPMYGKHHSKESLAKISSNNKGKHSHNKCRKHTPEELAKMSVAQKARWEKKKLENSVNK